MEAKIAKEAEREKLFDAQQFGEDALLFPPEDTVYDQYPTKWPHSRDLRFRANPRQFVKVVKPSVLGHQKEDSMSKRKDRATIIPYAVATVPRFGQMTQQGLTNLASRLITGKKIYPSLMSQTDKSLGPFKTGFTAGYNYTASVSRIREAWFFAYNSYRNEVEDDAYRYFWFDYNGENAGFLAQDKVSPGRYVLAFRGSQHTYDMADDIKSAVPLPIETAFGKELPLPIYCGVGPQARVNNLVADWGVVDRLYIRSSSNETWKVAQMLEDILEKGCDNLLVTGHSLGGGTAVAFAAVFAQLYYKKHGGPALESMFECITFEGMRALTEDTVDRMLKTRWGRFLDNTVLRIVNSKDPVPNLPPKSAGFVHIGYAINMDKFNGFMLHGNNWVPGWLSRAFYADNGPHSMVPTTRVINAFTEDPSGATIIKGRGKVKKTRRSKMATMPAAQRKAYMAYVRSFKRK